ncbi:MAG: DUF397 domain-containing protein [Acidobacteriaceae bacterium]
MDLTGAAWRTSSYSGGNGGQCVEVAAIIDNEDGTIKVCAVRDSKSHRGPVLTFGSEQWRRFTTSVKAGRLDLA